MRSFIKLFFFSIIASSCGSYIGSETTNGAEDYGVFSQEKVLDSENIRSEKTKASTNDLDINFPKKTENQLLLKVEEDKTTENTCRRKGVFLDHLSETNSSNNSSIKLDESLEFNFMQLLKWTPEIDVAFKALKELCTKRKSLKSDAWSKYNYDYMEGKKSLNKLGLITGIDVNIEKHSPTEFVSCVSDFLNKINNMYEDYKKKEISSDEFIENISEIDSVLNSSISMLYLINTYRKDESRRYVEDEKISEKSRLSAHNTAIILDVIFDLLEVYPEIYSLVQGIKNKNQANGDSNTLKKKNKKQYSSTHPSRLFEQKDILNSFNKVFGCPKNFNIPKKFDLTNYVRENELNYSSVLTTLIRNEELRNGTWDSNLPPIMRIKEYDKRVDVLIYNISCCTPIFSNIIDKINYVVEKHTPILECGDNVEDINTFITEIRKVIKDEKENPAYKKIDKSIDDWLVNIQELLYKETFVDLSENDRNGPTKGLAYAGKWIPDKKEKQITKEKWYECMKIISSISAIRIFLESNGTMNIPFNVLSAELPENLYETVAEQKNRVENEKSERVANILFSLFLVQTIPNIIPGLKSIATLAAIGFASVNLINNKNKIHIINHKVKEYLGYF